MPATLEPDRSASRDARASERGDEAALERSARLRELRVAFAGGGTGGHIVPGKHLLAHETELGDVLWFCTGRAVEQRAFEGIDARIERVALQLEPDGGGAPSLARLAARTAPATKLARAALRSHRSEVVLGLGGFTSLPAVLAARSLGIPVTLLEINAARGRATRWLAPLSQRVFHAWQTTLPAAGGSERDVWTGAPLAPCFTRGAPSSDESARARAELGFDPHRPLLVVLGGSQGAGALNRFVAAHALEWSAVGLQVLHQTGPGRLTEGPPALPGVRTLEFVGDVRLALAAATLVLCRGGASTLAEIAALRRPAWVVPYGHHADRHQERNARQLGQGVDLVDETRLGPSLARELVQMSLPGAASELERRARELERALPLDAAERIWDELLACARRPAPRP